jgi:hypothetical protein
MRERGVLALAGSLPLRAIPDSTSNRQAQSTVRQH